MFLAGLILGALAGMWFGRDGIIAGAFIGGVAGLTLRAFTRHGVAAPGVAQPAEPPRIALLERRVERLEAALARMAEASERGPASGVLPQALPGSAAGPSAAAQPAARSVAVAPAAPAGGGSAPVPSPARTAPSPMPVYGPRPTAAASTPFAAPAPGAAPAPDGTPQAGAAPASSGTPQADARPASQSWLLDDRIRRWLTEGNLLARLGVIVLFFGVAFLLRYFAEHFTLPIEARLAGVAAVGAGLVPLGVRLARRRPGFGLSVQGAGCGVLYLTTFAAFRLYAVLPAGAAMVLLAAVAALTVWLALRGDSQPLAGLAIAGGFLAPVLVGGGGSPVPLFAWFAALNATIVALAWRHSWRALNVVGFIFTFVLGLVWGYRFYRPEYFGVVEPFLVVFFAFYVAIAVLHAKQRPLVTTAPVDALLVFGVPLVGFALQFALVRDMRYGAAWSALALAAIYAGLFGVLRTRGEPGLALLARAFGALAIVFVTVAIPNALSGRWTSAWWAVEAAGVYWIGCRQAQPLTRGFALLLQLAAAVMFLLTRGDAAIVQPFANAAFVGSATIALAAGVTAWLAEREPALGAAERVIPAPALAWAAAWWLIGGVHELARGRNAQELPALALGWCAATALAALLLRGALRWPRLVWLGAPVLPLLALATLYAWQRERTTLLHYGWLVWPASFAIHWAMLRAADRANGVGEGRAAALRPLRRDGLHAASALVLVAWLAWELSEWIGRITAPQTVWIACAAVLPAIAALWLAQRPAALNRWPVAVHARAYQRQAGYPVAFGVLAWVVLSNLLSPGDAAPLPYVPLLNPLDLTVLAALCALALWSRAVAMADRDRYPILAGAGFIALNGAVLRTAHHIAGIPWSLADLLASRPLQAALTLTWSVTALALMLYATRRSLRAWWSVGASLLAIVIAKLFLLDLATLSGLPRVVAFLGAGALLLVIGYVAPLPPAERRPEAQAGGKPGG